MKPFKPSSEQIRFAVEALTEVGIVDSDGTYAKEFKSSFSSFGATVSQCGFAIALTVFENPDSRSKVRKGVPIVIKHYLIRAFGQSMSGLGLCQSGMLTLKRRYYYLRKMLLMLLRC